MSKNLNKNMKNQKKKNHKNKNHKKISMTSQTSRINHLVQVCLVKINHTIFITHIKHKRFNLNNYPVRLKQLNYLPILIHMHPLLLSLDLKIINMFSLHSRPNLLDNNNLLYKDIFIKELTNYLLLSL